MAGYDYNHLPQDDSSVSQDGGMSAPLSAGLLISARSLSSIPPSPLTPMMFRTGSMPMMSPRSPPVIGPCSPSKSWRGRSCGSSLSGFCMRLGNSLRLFSKKPEISSRLIELHASTVGALFLSFDQPAFRGPYLDSHVEEYLIAQITEIDLQTTRIVLRISLRQPFLPDFERRKFDVPPHQEPALEIRNAIREHFSYKLSLTSGRISRQLKEGAFSLLFGMALLIVFLTLSRVLNGSYGESSIALLGSDFFSIAGWVVFWRPMENVMWGWRPVLRKRDAYMALSIAEVTICAPDGIWRAPGEPMLQSPSTQGMA